MPVDVADVIEDHGVRLAGCWPEHAADLLQVEAETGGRTQQDGGLGIGAIEALGNHIDRHQQLQGACDEMPQECVTMLH